MVTSKKVWLCWGGSQTLLELLLSCADGCCKYRLHYITDFLLLVDTILQACQRASDLWKLQRNWRKKSPTSFAVYRMQGVFQVPSEDLAVSSGKNVDLVLTVVPFRFDAGWLDATETMFRGMRSSSRLALAARLSHADPSPNPANEC